MIALCYLQHIAMIFPIMPKYWEWQLYSHTNRQVLTIPKLLKKIYLNIKIMCQILFNCTKKSIEIIITLENGVYLQCINKTRISFTYFQSIFIFKLTFWTHHSRTSWCTEDVLFQKHWTKHTSFDVNGECMCTVRHICGDHISDHI